MIGVYIDSNAWNWLFEQAVDLCFHLPLGEFSVYITREVEIELQVIPDIGKDGASKVGLKDYIKSATQSAAVKTSSVFGFYVEGVPDHLQPFGGFDQGCFQGEAEQAFYRQHEAYYVGRSVRPTTWLAKNQADMSVAARAFDSVVLTSDRKGGPIQEAEKAGGRVLFLDEVTLGSDKLCQLIYRRWPELGSGSERCFVGVNKS